jgi:probable F420-dependent oxidoreductase
MTRPLKIGAWVMYTDRWALPFTDLAKSLEDRGFESVWVGEHTHIPVEGSIFPEQMAVNFAARLPDPFVLLSAAAGVTSRIRLGTAISLAGEYEPIGLAHLVATLDFVSQGRVEFGIGYGSNPPEIRNRGIDLAHRRAILREKVLAMKEIWTNDVASFEGKYVRFSESWSWPKPVQKPHPPILLGVHASKRFPEVVDFCDGWIGGGGASEDDMRRTIGELHQAAEHVGRDPRSVRITLTVPLQTPSHRSRDFFGSAETFEDFVHTCLTPADIDIYAGLGIERIIVTLNMMEADLMERALDHLAEQLSLEPN